MYIVEVEGKLVPCPEDFPVHWLETRPGKPDPKTGFLPTLYTVTIVDFLNELGMYFYFLYICFIF